MGKLSDCLRQEAANARLYEEFGATLSLQPPHFDDWADRAAALEAEVADLRRNDKRYRALRDRHVENLPGDSAVLWNGSQYERSEADLDDLADWLIATPPAPD